MLLVTACYAPSLPAWFHGDDFVHVDLLSEHRPHVLKNIWRGSLTGEAPDHNYRPLAYTAFYIFNTGDSALPLRVFVLFMHVCTALLLWQVLLTAGTRRMAAAGGAILFALHPAVHMSVMWVSALGDVFAAFFCVMAMWGFLSIRPVWSRIGLVLICYAGAMLSKETGFVLPGLLLLLAWREKRIWREWVLWCVMFALAVLMLTLRSHLLQSWAAGPRTGYYFAAGFQTLVSVAKYIYSFAVPFPWHWTYEYPWLAAAGLMIPVGIAVLIKYSGWRTGLRDLAIASGLIVIPLAPVINVFANWYMYLPAIGFGYVASRLLQVLPTRTAAAVLIILGGWYGSMTVYTSRTFVRAGIAEQSILTELARIPEDRIIVVGMPRQYRGVPMITFSHHLELALQRFRSVEKQIDLPATTSLAHLHAQPERTRLAANQIHLAFSGEALNYFDLFRTRGTPWKSFTHVTAKNNWGLPTSITLELPDRRPVYAYEPTAEAIAFSKINREE